MTFRSILRRDYRNPNKLKGVEFNVIKNLIQKDIKNLVKHKFEDEEKPSFFYIADFQYANKVIAPFLWIGEIPPLWKRWLKNSKIKLRDDLAAGDLDIDALSSSSLNFDIQYGRGYKQQMLTKVNKKLLNKIQPRMRGMIATKGKTLEVTEENLLSKDGQTEFIPNDFIFNQILEKETLFNNTISALNKFEILDDIRQLVNQWKRHKNPVDKIYKQQFIHIKGLLQALNAEQGEIKIAIKSVFKDSLYQEIVDTWEGSNYNLKQLLKLHLDEEDADENDQFDDLMLEMSMLFDDLFKWGDKYLNNKKPDTWLDGMPEEASPGLVNRAQHLSRIFDEMSEIEVRANDEKGFDFSQEDYQHPTHFYAFQKKEEDYPKVDFGSEDIQEIMDANSSLKFKNKDVIEENYKQICALEELDIEDLDLNNLNQDVKKMLGIEDYDVFFIKRMGIEHFIQRQRHLLLTDLQNAISGCLVDINIKKNEEYQQARKKVLKNKSLTESLDKEGLEEAIQDIADNKPYHLLGEAVFGVDETINLENPVNLRDFLQLISKENAAFRNQQLDYELYNSILIRFEGIEKEYTNFNNFIKVLQGQEDIIEVLLEGSSFIKRLDLIDFFKKVTKIKTLYQSLREVIIEDEDSEITIAKAAFSNQFSVDFYWFCTRLKEDIITWQSSALFFDDSSTRQQHEYLDEILLATNDWNQWINALAKIAVTDTEFDLSDIRDEFLDLKKSFDAIKESIDDGSVDDDIEEASKEAIDLNDDLRKFIKKITLQRQELSGKSKNAVTGYMNDAIEMRKTIKGWKSVLKSDSFYEALGMDFETYNAANKYWKKFLKRNKRFERYYDEINRVTNNRNKHFGLPLPKGLAWRYEVSDSGKTRWFTVLGKEQPDKDIKFRNGEIEVFEPPASPTEMLQKYRMICNDLLLAIAKWELYAATTVEDEYGRYKEHLNEIKNQQKRLDVLLTQKIKMLEKLISGINDSTENVIKEAKNYKHAFARLGGYEKKFGDDYSGTSDLQTLEAIYDTIMEADYASFKFQEDIGNVRPVIRSLNGALWRRMQTDQSKRLEKLICILKRLYEEYKSAAADYEEEIEEIIDNYTSLIEEINEGGLDLDDEEDINYFKRKVHAAIINLKNINLIWTAIEELAGKVDKRIHIIESNLDGEVETEEEYMTPLEKIYHRFNKLHRTLSKIQKQIEDQKVSQKIAYLDLLQFQLYNGDEMYEEMEDKLNQIESLLDDYEEADFEDPMYFVKAIALYETYFKDFSSAWGGIKIYYEQLSEVSGRIEEYREELGIEDAIPTNYKLAQEITDLCEKIAGSDPSAPSEESLYGQVSMFRDEVKTHASYNKTTWKTWKKTLVNSYNILRRLIVIVINGDFKKDENGAIGTFISAKELTQMINPKNYESLYDQEAYFLLLQHIYMDYEQLVSTTYQEALENYLMLSRAKILKVFSGMPEYMNPEDLELLGFYDKKEAIDKIIRERETAYLPLKKEIEETVYKDPDAFFEACKKARALWQGIPVNFWPDLINKETQAFALVERAFVEEEIKEKKSKLTGIPNISDRILGTNVLSTMKEATKAGRSFLDYSPNVSTWGGLEVGSEAPEMITFITGEEKGIPVYSVKMAGKIISLPQNLFKAIQKDAKGQKAQSLLCLMDLISDAAYVVYSSARIERAIGVKQEFGAAYDQWKSTTNSEDHVSFSQYADFSKDYEALSPLEKEQYSSLKEYVDANNKVSLDSGKDISPLTMEVDGVTHVLGKGMDVSVKDVAGAVSAYVDLIASVIDLICSIPDDEEYDENLYRQQWKDANWNKVETLVTKSLLVVGAANHRYIWLNAISNLNYSANVFIYSLLDAADIIFTARKLFYGTKQQIKDKKLKKRSLKSGNTPLTMALTQSKKQWNRKGLEMGIDEISKVCWLTSKVGTSILLAGEPTTGAAVHMVSETVRTVITTALKFAFSLYDAKRYKVAKTLLIRARNGDIEAKNKIFKSHPHYAKMALVMSAKGMLGDGQEIAKEYCYNRGLTEDVLTSGTNVEIIKKTFQYLLRQSDEEKLAHNPIKQLSKACSDWGKEFFGKGSIYIKGKAPYQQIQKFFNEDDIKHKIEYFLRNQYRSHNKKTGLAAPNKVLAFRDGIRTIFNIVAAGIQEIERLMDFFKQIHSGKEIEMEEAELGDVQLKKTFEYQKTHSSKNITKKEVVLKEKVSYEQIIENYSYLQMFDTNYDKMQADLLFLKRIRALLLSVVNTSV